MTFISLGCHVSKVCATPLRWAGYSFHLACYVTHIRNTSLVLGRGYRSISGETHHVVLVKYLLMLSCHPLSSVPWVIVYIFNVHISRNHKPLIFVTEQCWCYFSKSITNISDSLALFNTGVGGKNTSRVAITKQGFSCSHVCTCKADQVYRVSIESFAD